MRRRIRSAAFPFTAIPLPQLLVDGVLVALAYFLAYRLRFEDGLGGANHRYWLLLTLDDRLGRARDGGASLAAFGAYQRLWTFVGQREYEAVVKGVLVGTFVVVGAVALVPSGADPGADRAAAQLQLRAVLGGPAARRRDRAVLPARRSRC